MSSELGQLNTMQNLTNINYVKRNMRYKWIWVKVVLHTHRLSKKYSSIKKVRFCLYVHVSINISDYSIGIKLFNSFPQSIKN
jgi:hypothetical protein